MNSYQVLLAIIFYLLFKTDCKIAPHIFSPENTAFYQCIKTSGYDWITSYIPSDSKQLAP